MGVYISNLRLPSEYQEVEYIESVGGQYINTGYLPSSAPKIEIDFMQLGNTTSDNWYAIYGRRGSSTSTYFCIYVNKTSPYYMTPNYAGLDPGASSGITAPIGAKVNVVNDKGQFYVDGNYISASSTTNTLASATYPIYLFGNNINGTNQNRGTKMRLYHCKMWNDGTLVRDFIPCYRKSDSVIGLYDLVNNQFYTNSGTGTFSKGNDVAMPELKNIYLGEPNIPAIYQEVEYIQSTATNPGTTSSSGQVINTGYTHNPNTKIEIDYQYLSTTVQQRMFGSETTNSSYSTFVTYINGSGKWARATKGGEGNWQSTEVTADTNRHKFILDKSTYSIYNADGTQIHSGSNAYTITKNGQYPLSIFATRNSGYSSYIEHASAKLYGCKIWDNGTLVRDFVPCYRKSDNVIGMYDKVNDTFYVNSGSGSFTKGGNVN